MTQSIRYDRLTCHSAEHYVIIFYSMASAESATMSLAGISAENELMVR